MNLNPLVSIIIPMFNRELLIIKTLESITAQTYQNWECIIVDDHSTDSSNEVVEKYIKTDPRFQLLKRPGKLPKGANACRNYGFEVSKGEYINWFDSDDIMLTSFIDDKLSEMLRENVKVCFCSHYISDAKLVVTQTETIKSEDIYKDYLLWKCFIITNSPMFFRSFLAKKSLFNLSIHRAQETEFFFRIFKNLKKEDYRILKKPLFYYVQHPDSKSGQVSYNKKFVNSRYYVFRTIYDDNEKDPEISNAYYTKIKKTYFYSLLNKDFETSSNIKKYLFEINEGKAHRTLSLGIESIIRWFYNNTFRILLSKK